MLAWPLALLFAVAMRATQLRFERYPSVHEVFLNMWAEGNHDDTHFCQVLVSTESNILLLCLVKKQLTPKLFINVLMRVSQI